MRDLVECARVERELVAGFVPLSANAIVLLLAEEWDCARAAKLLGRLDGRGKDALGRMKQPHARLVEPAVARKQRGFATVAQQHIGALTRVNSDAGSARQRIF